MQLLQFQAWLNNCVHNHNYKSFVLFLFYGFLLCVYVLATSLPSFVMFWQGRPASQQVQRRRRSANERQLHFRLSASLHSSFYRFSPFSSASQSHVYSSITFFSFYTIEQRSVSGARVFQLTQSLHLVEQWTPALFEYGQDSRAYDLGYAGNFTQIFGTSKLHWFLPSSPA